MGIPRRRFRIPGGGKVRPSSAKQRAPINPPSGSSPDGTGRICATHNPPFMPYRTVGLETVWERVTITVRVSRMSDRKAFSAVLARHPVSIPTVEGADAEVLGLADDCTGADPAAPKLRPVARLGTTPTSNQKRKNHTCVDYARAYAVSAPRHRLDAFVTELQSAGVLVAPPEFGCAKLPGFKTTMARSEWHFAPERSLRDEPFLTPQQRLEPPTIIDGKIGKSPREKPSRADERPDNVNAPPAVVPAPRITIPQLDKVNRGMRPVAYSLPSLPSLGQ